MFNTVYMYMYMHLINSLAYSLRYCEQCCSEEEFFIRKAIGWALRQYHRTNPKDVVAFVRANEHKLSTLSVREALKHAK